MGDVHTKVFAVLLAFALASLGDAANEISKAGITAAGAGALCTLAAGLEETAKKAGQEARNEMVRARTIAQAAWRSQQAATAAAEEVNASAGSAASVLEEMHMGQRAERAMRKAEELAELASETQARCGFLAGQIKQWIEQMAAMATQKDGTGKFCLGGGQTGGGQAVLDTGDNGRNRDYATHGAVAPPKECDKLFATKGTRGWRAEIIDEWPELNNSVTVDSAGILTGAAAGQTVCPITGVVGANGVGGNYRQGVTWAGLWSITTISTANSITTQEEKAQLDKIKALVENIKDLAAESSARETDNTEEKEWENTCTWEGINLCDAGPTRQARAGRAQKGSRSTPPTRDGSASGKPRDRTQRQGCNRQRSTRDRTAQEEKRRNQPASESRKKRKWRTIGPTDAHCARPLLRGGSFNKMSENITA
ncbi:hypothetical protein ERJ75_000374500 [Trypanosoma vivax]|nr:hypothetical protein ERJ75_000374500 [Trypanosoma vivax]